MRLLHTSDWHLGRCLHGADLRPAQEAFIDHLVDTVLAERVDVVLVAGDVYDRAVPPLEAVTLCDEALVRLRRAGAQVVMISGNHDSARRLGFGSDLVDAAGVFLRTRPETLDVPVLLEDEHGPVAVYAIPYLEPAAVGAQLPGDLASDADPARGHGAVLARASTAIHADLAGRRVERSVVLAHGWVVGGLASDSERDIAVGGAGMVSADLFSGFTYSALGHLHRSQVVNHALRYSGSPLPYSFSEASQVKGSWLIECNATGLGTVEFVPAPVFRRLSCLRGEIDELLTAPAHREFESDFVSVTLTDLARPMQAMDRLRSRFPHVLTLAFETTPSLTEGQSYRDRVRGRDDVAVAAAFVEHVRRTPLDEAERKLLNDALEWARRDADADERQEAAELTELPRVATEPAEETARQAEGVA